MKEKKIKQILPFLLFTINNKLSPAQKKATLSGGFIIGADRETEIFCKNFLREHLSFATLRLLLLAKLLLFARRQKNVHRTFFFSPLA